MSVTQLTPLCEAAVTEHNHDSIATQRNSPFRGRGTVKWSPPPIKGSRCYDRRSNQEPPKLNSAAPGSVLWTHRTVAVTDGALTRASRRVLPQNQTHHPRPPLHTNRR
jgi:hypothetical protein